MGALAALRLRNLVASAANRQNSFLIAKLCRGVVWLTLRWFKSSVGQPRALRWPPFSVAAACSRGDPTYWEFGMAAKMSYLRDFIEADEEIGGADRLFVGREGER